MTKEKLAFSVYVCKAKDNGFFDIYSTMMIFVRPAMYCYPIECQFT